MVNQVWSSLGWILGACVLGFSTSAVFSGWMKLSRSRFLFPYVSLAGIFLYVFTLSNQIDPLAILMESWTWGILAGVLLSVYLVMTVRKQPLSRRSSGSGLVLDVTWAGLVYGMIDALFLNVMPVVAVWIAAFQAGLDTSPLEKIGVGIVGLLASLLVTLTYHLGYPEFRSRRVGLVLVGNSLITLAFLLSGSPFGSLISHTAMHIAAVLQGAETTIQLPPHYRTGFEQG